MQVLSRSSGLLTIDTAAISYNYQKLIKTAGPACQVAAVVKADAYGLGIGPIAKQLMKLNCPQFFVATLDEGIELRKIKMS